MGKSGITCPVRFRTLLPSAVRHLVDRIVTTEETGHRKPDPQIHQYAVEQLGAFPHTAQAHMHTVADSIDSDIKGALDSRLTPILYSPMSEVSQRHLFGQEAPVIRHMNQLLDHLSVGARQFNIQFASMSNPNGVIIKGIGIDLVTEPRHCLHISREIIRAIAQNIGLVLVHVADERPIAAMSRLEEMIRVIAKAAIAIDKTKIRMSFPDQDQGRSITSSQAPDCRILERGHSLLAEYESLALETGPDNQATLREVASLLQVHCDDFMSETTQEQRSVNYAPQCWSWLKLRA